MNDDRQLESQLRRMLRDEAPANTSSELRNRILTDVRRTPQRRRRFRIVGWWPDTSNLLAGMAAAGLTAVVALVVVGLLVASPRQGPGVVPSPSPTTDTAPAVSPTPPMSAPGGSPAATTPYPITALIPGASNFPVIAAGDIWAPRFGRGDLVRFDPTPTR